MTRVKTKRRAAAVLTHAEWNALPLERRLAISEKQLNRPTVYPFVGFPEYTGPNYPGKVNMLVTLASRIAKGAVNDGMQGVCMMADEWRRDPADDDEMRALVAELEELDPKAVRQLLALARRIKAGKL